MSTDRPDQPLSLPGSGIDITDTTIPVDPATYDPHDALNGIRPTRRTVTLHMRADLVGVLDAIAYRIETELDDDRYNALVEKFERIQNEFRQGVTQWTVEQRSTDWIRNRWNQYAGSHGITLTDGTTSDEADRLRLATHQLAGQVVEKRNVDSQVVATSATEDELRALYDSNETEFYKLIAAMNNANTEIAAGAGVLTRNFSRRSSTGRSGTAS